MLWTCTIISLTKSARKCNVEFASVFYTDSIYDIEKEHIVSAGYSDDTNGSGPRNTLGVTHHDNVNTTAFKNTFTIC